MTNDLRTNGKWKIKLTVKTNLYHQKTAVKVNPCIPRTITYKSQFVLIQMKLFFNSLLHSYQKSSEQSLKGIDSMFDLVHGLYYKCHKISFTRGGSHIYCPKWLQHKSKK